LKLPIKSILLRNPIRRIAEKFENHEFLKHETLKYRSILGSLINTNLSINPSNSHSKILHYFLQVPSENKLCHENGNVMRSKHGNDFKFL
jgi:hypothetical protein